MDSADKREFFRLNDKIHIAYQLVTKIDLEQGQAADFFTSDPNFHLLRDIYELEMESVEILRTLTDSNRQLGSFLHNLNQRIELLALGLRNINEEDDASVNIETQISEGGISFLADELINNGELMALKLLFQPSMVGLTCFAKVRYCRLVEEDNKYKIGAQFVNPDYTTQKLLSRHIIRKQSEERRKRLHESNFG
ncbi:MAG TPA: PilZ domain-containing protein [Pseudomonadales bacterium]|jgi:hypothetical protein|nr:PilZ domain-containing protein [Pseudomonadales bacterium]MDP6316675.1 PilZ domain-containing protein [Pseudomonadales bacterium]HJP49508.1 PilZ domain-containing protein [Pseudomonadales bacterium]|tara:strand:- start:1833 stop:2417 length:585 start_codon:yes stop_codon:yes gene_type:complete